MENKTLPKRLIDGKLPVNYLPGTSRMCKLFCRMLVRYQTTPRALDHMRDTLVIVLN